MGVLEVPIVLALAALVVYVLAILLRVSCHLCGVEIPALGRAYFSAAASAGLTLVAAYAVQGFFAGLSRRFDAVLQITSLVLILAANMALSTALYAALLEVRLGRAFNVWLVQAITFLGVVFVVGSCGGLLSLM